MTETNVPRAAGKEEEKRREEREKRREERENRKLY
jgi:hypothetical protein